MPAPAVPTSNQQIVVAARALSAGSKLAADSVKTIAWNGTSLPAGALRDPAQLQGRVLKSQAVADAPILEPMLLPVGAAMGLAADLAPGMRAMTLRVDQVVGVAGFVMPGDLVDVLLTGNAEAYKLYGRKSPPQTNSAMTQKMAFSKVVLEKVRVLAVAQQTDHVFFDPIGGTRITVSAQAEGAVSFLRVLGFSALPIAASAETRRSSVDLVMVTDMSSSILSTPNWQYVVKDSLRFFQLLSPPVDRAAQVIYAENPLLLVKFRQTPGFSMLNNSSEYNYTINMLRWCRQI